MDSFRNRTSGPFAQVQMGANDPFALLRAGATCRMEGTVRLSSCSCGVVAHLSKWFLCAIVHFFPWRRALLSQINKNKECKVGKSPDACNSIDIDGI